MNRLGLVLRPALVLILAAGLLWIVLGDAALDPETIESRIRGLGMWAPIGFMAFYIVATVLFMPAWPLSLAGGALFGPVWGIVYNLTSATLSATVAMLLGRYLAAGLVERRCGPKTRLVIDAVGAEGWRSVALIRMIPVIPFGPINYALGVTQIPVLHYALATLVFISPVLSAYTWLGFAGREAMMGGENLVRNLMIALPAVAVVVFLPRLIRRFRGTIAAHKPEN